MRRQSLILLCVAATLLTVMSALGFNVQRQASRLERTSSGRWVDFGAASLAIPDAFGEPCRRRHEGWEVREWQGGRLGHLELATQAPHGPFDEACAQWFELPAPSESPLRFEASDGTRVFMPLPLMERGACCLSKRGKVVTLTVVFDQEGVRHWLDYRTSQPFLSFKTAFDQMVLSLRARNGAAPDPLLAESLASVTHLGGWRFFQPVWILLVIPLLPIGLVALVMLLLRRASGRMPAALASGHPTRFLESGVEVGVLVRMQRQFFDATVAVDDESLRVYTFGSLFLELPREVWIGRLGTGEAILGPPFLEIRLEDPPAFRKWAWKWQGLRGPLTLRVYTQDFQRLHGAMG